jgi:DNA repair protein RadC
MLKIEEVSDEYLNKSKYQEKVVDLLINSEILKNIVQEETDKDKIKEILSEIVNQEKQVETILKEELNKLQQEMGIPTKQELEAPITHKINIDAYNINSSNGYLQL